MYSHIFHFNIFFNIHKSINQKNKFIHDTWVNLNHIKTSQMFLTKYIPQDGICAHTVFLSK